MTVIPDFRGRNARQPAEDIFKFAYPFDDRMEVYRNLSRVSRAHFYAYKRRVQLGDKLDWNSPLEALLWWLNDLILIH